MESSISNHMSKFRFVLQYDTKFHMACDAAPHDANPRYAGGKVMSLLALMCVSLHMLISFSLDVIGAHLVMLLRYRHTMMRDIDALALRLPILRPHISLWLSHTTKLVKHHTGWQQQQPHNHNHKHNRNHKHNHNHKHNYKHKHVRDGWTLAKY